MIADEADGGATTDRADGAAGRADAATGDRADAATSDRADRAPSGLEPSGYRDAIEELEALLDELEGADVDVDVLAARVARGVELIRFCRARLDVVTDDVDAVVAELISIEDLPGGDDQAPGP